MWNDSEFNSTFSSPGGGGGAEGKEIKKNLIRHIVPVTAETVNQCTQVEGETSLFHCKHLSFHQICLVGIIRSVIKRANDITYLINDMTSTDVNVKLQSDDSEDMESEENRPAHAQFMENQYVRVYGVVKQLQGQKIVQAFRMLPIKDLNEVTHHILECMNASIYYSSKVDGEPCDMPVGRANNPLKNSNLNGSNKPKDSFNDQVCAFVTECKSTQGVHISEICEHFKGVPEAKLRQALEFLSNEGHMYSTVDDDHFKSTVNDQ